MRTKNRSLETYYENDWKNLKDIEIVEIGRKHRNQNLFKPEWTCESMGAVKRTNLEITLSKCELKTDELGTDRSHWLKNNCNIVISSEWRSC